MKRFICAVAIVMACLVMAGGALAWDYVDHVSIAPGGKGDLVVFPVYVATPGELGIQTKLSITNTSQTHSVVAKVVVRSYVYSEELLDFLIYLSPTDMWIGTLDYGDALDRNNQLIQGARIFGSDASAPALAALFAQNRGKALNETNCPLDSNEIGYVEVIEAWAGNLGAPTVDKEDIIAAYNAFVPVTPISTTINSLAASYQISVPALGWEASDNAVVFRDYDNIAKLDPAILTLIGANGEARNTIHEVEAALSKDAIAMAYNASDETGGTLHAFTFPTKLSDYVTCDRASQSGSNFFPSTGLVPFTLNVFDNEENTTVVPGNPWSPQNPDLISMPDEVSFIPFPSSIFDFGWMRYTFNKVGGTSGVTAINPALPIGYTGAPVIPTIIDFNEGLSIRSGAWTDGVVTDGGTVILPAYQFTSASSTSIGQ